MQAHESGVGNPPGPDQETESRDMLSRMIREANSAGESFQRLADRAIDPETGETLSKPYFQKMAAGKIKTPPTAERVRAMAAALRKPPAVVQRAAAVQFFDYQASELSGYDDETRIIVAHLAGKTPAERRRWRMMMEASELAGDD